MSSDTTPDTEADTDPTAHWSFETKQIHAGQQPCPATGAPEGTGFRIAVID